LNYEPGQIYTNSVKEKVRIIKASENKIVWEKLKTPGNHFVLTPESFGSRFYVKVED
jgi:hypothetical protein